MIKIKWMYYQPYEYQLLQDKLNELAQEGYYTNHLSIITLFKKRDDPVYYAIDFHKVEGKNKYQRRINVQPYYDQFLDQDYQPIYNKQYMHVFVGKKPLKNIKIKEDLQCLSSRRLYSFIFIPLLVFIIAFLSLSIASNYNIDTLNTYGITLAYIGLFLLLFTMLYRQYHNYAFFQKIYKNEELPITKIKIQRQIFLIFSCISIALTIIGLGEDFINTKNLNIKDKPIMVLNDLGYNEESTMHYYRQNSSFTIKKSYKALESIDDEKILFTKIYELSHSKSKELFQQYQEDPTLYSCTTCLVKDDVIYGYLEEECNVIIIHQDQYIILVSTSFNLSSQQIQEILNYYKK